MEETIGRKSIVFAAIGLLLQFCCGTLSARPITAHQAERAVAGWLRADAQPLRAVLGRRTLKIETFMDDTGEPIYHVVYLQPAGFVIVSADDLVEPIIAFAEDGTYDPSLENPLGALVTGDLGGRMADVRAGRHLRTRAKGRAAPDPKSKWGRLANLAEASTDELGLMGLTTPSDIRVPPLLESKWSQHKVCGNDCYNYYTPGNYNTGCVATAMAQLMRYHQHPATGIGQHSFKIKKDNSSYWVYTRGGNGYGSEYDWGQMVLAPNCSTTPTQRSAIGALCHDAAISVNTAFTDGASQADTLKAKGALASTFKYANAVKGYNSGNNIGDGLIEMLNPNLDAKDPVILGISKGSSGHAVVCDGYGYNSSTLYHHLNMGWSGSYNAWYNLPNVDSNPGYTSVYKCIYNIRTTSVGDGEVISGRVLDHTGQPIPNPTVYAEPAGEAYSLYAESDSRGIYAFDDMDSATTYTITASVDGYVFSSRVVTTGTSRDNYPTSGNVRGIDFAGTLAGDFDGDGDVDLADFAELTSAWLSRPGDAKWNPDCDIGRSDDAIDIIDMLDLDVFTNNWLKGTK